MPNREFLEEYPLYRKFKMDLPEVETQLEKPAIHMHCPVCGSEQTFNADSFVYFGSCAAEMCAKGSLSLRLLWGI